MLNVEIEILGHRNSELCAPRKIKKNTLEIVGGKFIVCMEYNKVQTHVDVDSVQREDLLRWRLFGHVAIEFPLVAVPALRVDVAVVQDVIAAQRHVVADANRAGRVHVSDVRRSVGSCTI